MHLIFRSFYYFFPPPRGEDFNPFQLGNRVFPMERQGILKQVLGLCCVLWAPVKHLSKLASVTSAIQQVRFLKRVAHIHIALQIHMR